MAGISKMAFGNRLGVAFEDGLSSADLFENGLGDIVLEVSSQDGEELLKKNAAEMEGLNFRKAAVVRGDELFTWQNVTVSMEEALQAWKGSLEKVFPTRADKGTEPVETKLYKADRIYICKNKTAKPKVFIPVFPGTNCEYDAERAFVRAGANVTTRVFRNRTAEDIRDCVKMFAEEIGKAQIIMFPGGFSAGYEPEGSAKFFATVFRNAVIKEEIEKLKYNSYVQNTYLRRAPTLQCLSDGNARGMGAEGAQSGRYDILRSARPLRSGAGRRRGALARNCAGGCGGDRPRIRFAGYRTRRRALVEEPQDAHWRDRDRGLEHRYTQSCPDASLYYRGDVGRRRRP